MNESVNHGDVLKLGKKLVNHGHDLQKQMNVSVNDGNNLQLKLNESVNCFHDLKTREQISKTWPKFK